MLIFRGNERRENVLKGRAVKEVIKGQMGLLFNSQKVL